MIENPGKNKCLYIFESFNYVRINVSPNINQKLFSALMDSKTWIDLNDHEKEGTFVDSKGRAPLFRHWNVYEPNDFWGEDCAQVSRIKK